MTAQPLAAPSGAAVALRGLRRSYGDVHALAGLDLDLAAGEMVVLLGPSGCGKTTALRILAGLEAPDAGSVAIGGAEVTRVPPDKRDLGMVFQAYSLFPHLTVLDNVAFGLRLRGRSRSARRERAAAMLDLVGLGAHHDRFPVQLSGGQQQRVALARALAVEPAVLLLDEPLSALDAQVRVQLREEIRRIQQEVGTTTLFVTHDQEEALAVADRVGVMNAGRLEQIAPPVELYTAPATGFVAGFIGLSNPVAARVGAGRAELPALGASVPVLPGSVDGAGTALVRPESLGLAADPDGPARVLAVSFLGAVTRYEVALPDGTRLTVQAGSRGVPLRVGDAVRVEVEERAVLVVAAAS